MFSGIVEAKGQVLESFKAPGRLRIKIRKPKDYSDLRTGDSIAVDGVCLTLEAFDEQSMQFSVAAETLHITNWSSQFLNDREVNLERSLKVGDRIHGHFVSGHVDALGQVTEVREEGDSLWVWISFPKDLLPMVWKKGSIAINGVSLTVNEVSENALNVCLIPETRHRTNLNHLQVDQPVNLECDTFARGLVHYLRSQGRTTWN